MAMISDVDYVVQAIRLASIRATEDPWSSRVISLDPSFSLNPYINASGLSDVDRWPEIKRATYSPPPSPDGYSSDDVPRRRGLGGGRLQYTQTIMGGKSGAMGMRVSGRQGGRREVRATSSSATGTETPDMGARAGKRGSKETTPTGDGFFSPSGRPRADSAPMPILLNAPSAVFGAGTSMITTGRGMGVGGLDVGVGVLEKALSASEMSGDLDEDDFSDSRPINLGAAYDTENSSMGIRESERPSDLGLTAGDAACVLGSVVVDEGSDLDEDDIEEEADMDDEEQAQQLTPPVVRSQRSFIEVPAEQLIFTSQPVKVKKSGLSALTAALNKHVPHLVSTSSAPPASTSLNPFVSLYASAAALPSAPAISLQIYFPHSSTPGKPLIAKIRKDASVEEATGYGLFRYWEEGREPRFSEHDGEDKLSTVGWGLRIVEDDGEVDEDFPPLNRDSQISKFAYGQFAIVQATASQVKQNAAKAPHIVRRPSRVIAPVIRSRPSAAGQPSFAPPQQPAAGMSSASFSSSDLRIPGMAASAMKGSVGLSSALSKPVLMRVKVTTSADVHFTTTISVPSDMYIADLTEVLCKKKRLQNPGSDWVLCLVDLTLALPLDRTVASLEGRTDLALVRRQWAVEHGLRIGDRRGGDPSASIFKRISEPAPLSKYGTGLAELSHGYKKYYIHRKIAIGRHERVLTIDGDYIHIMPSESRAFFDSMKTTSFHVTLVASCKLTGRAGGFKINVWREGGQKRYEFEADNGKMAAEIISSIRQLMKSYQSERNSMMPPPRPATTPNR